MNTAPVPTKEARTGCGGFTDDTENLSTTCRQSKHPFNEVRPPRKITHPQERLPEGHMRFLLPEGLDPTRVRWGSGERPARIAYAAHQISIRPFDAVRDYVALHSPTIKCLIGGTSWADAKLKLGPFLEIDDDYRIGKYSKGYRWNDELRSRACIAHIIRCPRFLEHLRKHDERGQRSLSPIEMGVLQDLHLLRCAIDDPEAFALNLMDSPAPKDEFKRRACVKGSIYDIHDQNYRNPIRDKNGRLHCLLTRTPREVRPHLTIHDEAVVEVDLANSQPLLMVTVFPDVPGLRDSVIAGQFYPDLNANLSCPYDIENPHEKRQLKRDCLMWIYARPTENGYRWFDKPDSRVANIAKAADVAFPGLDRRIRDNRSKNGWTSLANEMQKRESGIFIDGILPEFQRLGIPAIPIHDSFLCRSSHADCVKAIVEDTIMKHTGLRSLVRIGG